MILLLSAMPEEIAALRAGLQLQALEHGAGREFARGFISDHEVVLAFSRWGKVAAAATAAHALSRYSIEAVVFTGIAGALAASLQPLYRSVSWFWPIACFSTTSTLVRSTRPPRCRCWV